MAAFLEILFPNSVAYGMTGGPEYVTDVISFVNGREQRNLKRGNGINVFDAAHGVKTPAQLTELIAFFRTVRGRAYGFRFHDWLDYKLTDELIGTGNASTTVFNATKKYGTTNIETRRIYKLAATTWSDSLYTYPAPVIKLNDVIQGSGYTIDYINGTVTFSAAPGAAVTVKYTGYFHNAARFDIDQMSAAITDYEVYDWGSIPVRELTNVADLV